MPNNPPLTPWYPGTSKPVRNGWYDTALEGDKPPFDRRYWNGSAWSFAQDKSAASMTQDWMWRGAAISRSTT